MGLPELRQGLIDRLNQDSRGDRGWFLLTRVHVALSWIKGIAEYLESRGGHHPIQLTGHDYQRLAIIAEISQQNPGLQLRRHHLLVMEKPLQLLQRASGNSWESLALTDRGYELAHTNDPANVLEQSLSAIRFATAPSTTPNRIRVYHQFDVRVFNATHQVLTRCDGFIDRNEFDFFLSRIRDEGEISWAVNCIRAYRQLTKEKQNTLHVEVRSRLPNEKSYSNWRDIGLHTFSLFSLGTSMIRQGQRLFQISNRNRTPGRRTRPGPTFPTLKIPSRTSRSDLMAPPMIPASNTGADAENFVAKFLQSQGWMVVFYTRRRGYGFDLWARKNQTAVVIEVKSSLQTLGTVTLTLLEYEAASHYQDGYVLALVEQMGTQDPKLHLIQNPVSKLRIKKRQAAEYFINRTEWLGVTTSNS